MRVLIRWQARRRACVLAGMLLAVGTGAPAAAKTAEPLVLEEGAELVVDLSSTDRATITVPPGDGAVLLTIRERFVELSVQAISDSWQEPPRRSISAEIVPILVVLNRKSDRATLLELAVDFRTGRNGQAIVTLDDIQGEALAATVTEAGLSTLPLDASDRELASALALTQSARLQWRALGNETAEARVTYAASELAYELGDFEAALRHASAALAIYERLQSSPGAAYARSMIGLVYTEMGEADAARAALRQARAVLAPIYADKAVNPADGVLCYLSFETNDLDAARACYEALIEQAESFGDELRPASYRNNLAGVYWRIGDMLRAAQTLRRVIEQTRSRTKPADRLIQLNNYAVSLRYLGDLQGALNHYQQALALADSIGDKSQQDRVRNNLAVIYGDLRAPHQALPILEQLYQEHIGDGDVRAARSTINYAGALVDTGDLKSAATLIDQSIELSESLQALGQLTTALRLRAEIALRSRAPGAALGYAARALNAATEIGDRERARLLLALGRAQLMAGKPDVAVPLIEAARTLWEDAGNPYGEVTALAAMGQAVYETGDVPAARALALQTIERIERLRSSVASSDLRASYQAGVSEVFTLAIECLIAEGDSRSALAMTERYRARALIDVLSRGSGRRNTEIPPELLEKRTSLIARINRIEAERLRGKPPEPIAGLLSELDVIDDQITATDPELSSLKKFSAAEVPAIQALHEVGESTAVYFVGRRRSVVWIVSRDDVTMIELADPSTIQDEARALHNVVSRRGVYTALARTLGEHLLLPLRSHLASARNVSIVADGSLLYVPFDVLTVDDGAPPFLERRPISYLPSLTALALTRQMPEPSGKGVTVIADPVFNGNDARVTATRQAVRSTQTLNRLRLTRLEAEAIQQRASDADIDVSVHVGLAAQPAILRSQDVQQAGILHIATHGFADDDIPARSGLALSMVDEAGEEVTGFVGLRDIYNLQLDADLVVLSACETALGQELAGEGLLGLTRGFMYAGARRVVATLWRVEDRATATLMDVFYRELFDGTAPAMALAIAKSELSEDRRYRHPYYWSGFTLQGDWRAATVR